jgi:hypothetical protein
VFVSHPEAVSTSPWPACRYCEPDGLGVVDLRHQWDRKATDAALAGYRELSGPAAPSEDDLEATAALEAFEAIADA